MKGLISENAHYLADFLTLSRFFIALMLLYYAIQGFSIRAASIIVITGWFTDVFDGMIARKYGNTSLGFLDLPADLTFVSAIIFYLVYTRLFPLKWVAGITLLLLSLALAFKNEAPMNFWMGVVYGGFIYSAVRKDSHAFVLLLIAIITIIVLNPSRAFDKVVKFLKNSSRLFSSGDS